MRSFRPLHDGWTVAAVAETLPAGMVSAAVNTPADATSAATVFTRAVPATVPGCVHTDLLAAGLIDDPYLDDNEERLAWIGRTDWVYETTFDWSGPAHERVDLVCAGLDTVATVTAQRQSRSAAPRTCTASYRFDVRSLLRPGDNTLLGPLRLGVPLRRGAAGPARRPAERLSGAVQLHPQDGLQLRLGLGPDPGHRRHLAGDRAATPGRAPGWRPSVPWSPLSGRHGRDHRAGAVAVNVERASDRPVTVRAEVAGAQAEVDGHRPGERTAVLTLDRPASPRSVVAPGVRRAGRATR